MAKLKETPPVLAAQDTKQKYHKPTFEVIDLNIPSPLLSGSGNQPAGMNPIGRKSI